MCMCVRLSLYWDAGQTNSKIFSTCRATTFGLLIPNSRVKSHFTIKQACIILELTNEALSVPPF